MAIEDYYTETITKITVTNSTDDFSTADQTLTSATFSGAINPRNGAEFFAGGRNFPDADYKLFCSDTVTLDEQDRIRWSGSTFNIVFVKDTFNMAHHKLCLLKRNI